LQSSHQTEAEARLRAGGARVTGPRIKVLAALLASACAMTHQEVLRRAGRQRGLDRVTTYRVLQWLEDQGLVHKITDHERVWRFVAGRAAQHPHFKCERCGTVTCLEHAKAPGLKMPRGYRPNRVELTVRGLCANCRRG
jgi:Fur family ferric uptake transcriptional regulator